MSALTADRSPGRQARPGPADRVPAFLPALHRLAARLRPPAAVRISPRPRSPRAGAAADHLRSPPRHSLPGHRHRDEDREWPAGDQHPHHLARTHPVARGRSPSTPRSTRNGASARSTRSSSTTPTSPARPASPSPRICPASTSKSPTSICRAPSCASASPIRAASAPIRGSAPAAGRLRLQPGGGGGSPGFFARSDARSLLASPLVVEFAYDLRGNRSLGLAPDAGDTRMAAQIVLAASELPGQLPARAEGWSTHRASTRSTGSATSRSAASWSPPATSAPPPPRRRRRPTVHRALQHEPGRGPQCPAAAERRPPASPRSAWSSRSTSIRGSTSSAKYGFLFIGFTFLAFLLFDVIGGVRVSAVEYLLVGAGLVLFFVMLLAFAEVIGFAFAYILASAAIAGLNTAYSAAVLKSWRRDRLHRRPPRRPLRGALRPA